MHVTTPKFELPIAQEGMVYKIWDSVYKIVQNKYKIMMYFSFPKSVLGGPVTCTSIVSIFSTKFITTIFGVGVEVLYQALSGKEAALFRIFF